MKTNLKDIIIKNCYLFLLIILVIPIINCNSNINTVPSNIDNNPIFQTFTTIYTHTVFDNIILYSNFTTTAEILTIYYESVNFVGGGNLTNLLIRIDQSNHMSLISNSNRLISTNIMSNVIISTNHFMSNIFISKTNYTTNSQLSNIYISIIHNGDTINSKIKFENTDDISGVVLLTNADLSDLNFNGYNFSNANLNGANLRNSDLTGANLSNAILHNTFTNGIVLTGAAGINSSTFSNANP